MARKALRRPATERRRIEPGEISAIVGMLDSWEDEARVTWERLVQRVYDLLHHRWTRQALESNPAIKEAYLRRRDREMAGLPAPKKKDPLDVLHRRQVDALNAEIAQLKQTLAKYEELFVRDQYHAERKGLLIEELARPIPSTDRGRTDKPKNAA